MIVVKLHSSSDTEFETREQLEVYIEHVNNVVSAYALLKNSDLDLALDFLDWVSEQYSRADANLFCALECRTDFDLLEWAYEHRRQAEEAR